MISEALPETTAILLQSFLSKGKRERRNVDCFGKVVAECFDASFRRHHAFDADGDAVIHPERNGIFHAYGFGELRVITVFGVQVKRQVGGVEIQGIFYKKFGTRRYTAPVRSGEPAPDKGRDAL